MILTEKFSAGSSPLHRLDPRMKVIGAACLALATACNPSLPALYLALVLSIVLVIAARLPLREVCKQLAAVNLFVLMLWLVVPLTPAGSASAVHSLGPVRFYGEGIALCHHITVKANAVTLFIITLLTTTPIQQLGRAMQQLGVSRKFTLLLVTTFRYLGLIQEEYARLRRAAAVRCFRPETTVRTYKTYGYLIGMTFVRSYNRARRIDNAMLMRGFNGSFPVLDAPALQRKDLWAGLLLVGCALALAGGSFM